MDATPSALRRAHRMPKFLLLVAGLIGVACTGCDWVSRSQNVTGVDLYEQGNYGAAIEQFQLAIQSNPGDADSYYNIGATYQRLAAVTHNPTYTQQAEQFYHVALDMNPNHCDCNRGLAVLYVEENRPAEAFALMQRWTERNPVSPEPRIELARLYEEFGEHHEARSPSGRSPGVATDQHSCALRPRQVERRFRRSGPGIGHLRTVAAIQPVPAGRAITGGGARRPRVWNAGRRACRSSRRRANDGSRPADGGPSQRPDALIASFCARRFFPSAHRRLAPGRSHFRA